MSYRVAISFFCFSDIDDVEGAAWCSYLGLTHPHCYNVLRIGSQSWWKGREKSLISRLDSDNDYTSSCAKKHIVSSTITLINTVQPSKKQMVWKFPSSQPAQDDRGPTNKRHQVLLPTGAGYGWIRCCHPETQFGSDVLLSELGVQRDGFSGPVIWRISSVKWLGCWGLGKSG